MYWGGVFCEILYAYKEDTTPWSTIKISEIETELFAREKIYLKTVIDIINALHCSADELLCIEIEQARPRLNDWFVELLADCSDR